MDTPIHGYKGFNKDMTCRDFKFEVGKKIKADTWYSLKRGKFIKQS